MNEKENNFQERNPFDGWDPYNVDTKEQKDMTEDKEQSSNVYETQEPFKEQSSSVYETQEPFKEQGHDSYPNQGSSNSDNSKLFSILSYIPPLWIIGLVCEQNNEDVKFHVNQGILLTIFSFIVPIILGILCITVILIPLIIPAFIVFPFLDFILMIIGIVNAAKGERKPLPLIGNLYTFIK